MRRLAAGRSAEWLDARLGFARASVPMLSHPDPRGRGRADGLVVRLRQRVDDAAHDPDRHRHRPGAGLRAGRRQGL